MSLATPDEIRQARELYSSDDVNIDDGALASRGDDGVWVAAWVWLGTEDRTGDAGDPSPDLVGAISAGVPYEASPAGMTEAHAEGLHSEMRREGCPECRAQGPA